MNLFEMQCSNTLSNTEPFSKKEVMFYLEKLQNWSEEENYKKIKKKFEFKNFKEAFNFVRLVVILSETENHHPEISFGWGYVCIEIFTHSINGLNINDFILASKIDKI